MQLCMSANHGKMKNVRYVENNLTACPIIPVNAAR